MTFMDGAIAAWDAWGVGAADRWLFQAAREATVWSHRNGLHGLLAVECVIIKWLKNSK